METVNDGPNGFLNHLHKGLTTSYSFEELKTVCFSINVDFDDLPGGTKEAKARELLSYLDRRGKLQTLIDYCLKERPNFKWGLTKTDHIHQVEQKPNNPIYQQLNAAVLIQGENAINISGPNAVVLGPNAINIVQATDEIKRNELSLAEQYQIATHWAENGRKESLYGFNLRGCVLWEVDFERADLRMADLSGADLGQANLQKANLTGADLREANLFNAFLHGAKIDETTQIDKKYRLVMEIIEVAKGVKNRDLRRIDLNNTILVWGELSGSDLTGADLSGSTLISAKFIKTNLSHANLSECDLGMANLHQCKLTGATLRNANLLQTDLSEADLRGTDLTNAKLVYGDSTMDSIFPANLLGLKYNNETIWPINFEPSKWGAVLIN